MKATPIDDPIQRERLLEVRPEIALFPDAGRRRRLNVYPGRTLDHTALAAEQRWRAARTGALGRVASSGVLNGLGVGAISDTVDGTSGSELYLASGKGLTVGGELVTVNRAQRARLGDVFVQRHEEFRLRASDPRSGRVLAAPSLPTLDELGTDVPSEGILVLQPVFAEMLTEQDDHACDFDAAAFAHTDWQYMDAARLVLYTWPHDWLTLPAGADQRRNRVAHAIFERERTMPAGEIHPWERLGVPIALVGLSDDRATVSYVDQGAVKRAGGGALDVPDLVPVQGNPRLWQALFEQFNAQLAETLDAAEDVATGLAASRELFRYLPPAGVLPRSLAATGEVQFVEPRARRQDFFPAHYDVACRVLPYEQLDVALRQSLPLRPFDLASPENVEVLVPVPQSLYEPDLLSIETLASEFDEAVRRFTNARNDLLGRRLDVRLKASALQRAITGRPLDFGLKEPGQLEYPDVDAVDAFERSMPMHGAPVEVGAVWRYRKGTAAPPAAWATNAFNDSTWQSGASGFGYGRAGLGTILNDMPSGYHSVFLRNAFTLDSVDLVNQYILEIVIIGGFVAFLNGAEVLRHNMPGNASSATFAFDVAAVGKSATRPVRLVLDAASLQPGVNVLAIQAHSVTGVREFTVQPRLVSRTHKTGWPLLGVDEPAFGLTFDPTAREAPSFEAEYTVDSIEKLRALLDESTPLAQAEIDALDANGLEEFLHGLEARIAGANDKVDFGFVRLQTDIYRIRQFVLGNTEGTKLATSPILASIALGETAAATRDEITSFVQRLQSGAGGGGTAGSREASAPREATRRSGGTIGGAGLRGGTDLLFSADLSASARTSAVLSATNTRLGGSLEGTDIFGTTAGTLVGAQAEKLTLKATGATTASGGRSELFGGTSTKDIEQQTSIVGSTSQYHNVTVAQRLAEPIATNAKTAAIATKAGVLQDFRDVGINIADLAVPGVLNDAGAVLTFADLDDARITEVLAGEHDRNAVDADGNLLGDESAFFNSGVRALENSAVLLRQVEGRIHAYRRALERGRETLATLRAAFKEADVRLAEISEALAEARHDLTVARAVRREEVERVAVLNAHRDAILNEHVPFYLFRRPRFSDTHRDLPARTMLPGFALPPVPECEVDEADTPEELSAMIDLVRDAPLRWFTLAPELMKKLNRKRDLDLVLIGAREKALKSKASHPLFGSGFEFEGKLEKLLNDAYGASFSTISKERDKRRTLDAARYLQRSWRDTSAKVEESVSLGDVIDGNHGRAGANKQAATALEDLRRVAACLYQGFGAVNAAVRLQWIDRLSQFDASVNLSNLYALPRWDQVDAGRRRELQRMVDWLYGQVDGAFANATTLIDDLVRVCLLLASHAPVARLITGATVEETPIEPGVSIRINTDIRRVQIGMEVLLNLGGRVVGKGAIRDVGGGEVVAEVIDADANVRLAAGAKVQIRPKQATHGGTQRGRPARRRHDAKTANGHDSGLMDLRRR